jgi:putative heme-binding domain-containing protein
MHQKLNPVKSTLGTLLVGTFCISCMFIACINNIDTTIEEEPEIHVPEGFTLEELYHPSASNMGTWVALAEGPNETFYACDQWGGIYTFQKPAIGEMLDSTMIDSLELDLGFAHGMMWAFNSLYVAVNRGWSDEVTYGSGVYRLTDQDGDGTLDSINMLLKLDGAGEHGPHSFVLAPNGNDIYFIAGNHTSVPEEVSSNSRLPTHWGEDNLLPTYPDARGHAVHIKAPGGWIAKTDSLGEDWELISAGYRNAFDIAFNNDGELFAFDADMEWDFGMPWYRPIRICHATSGSEFGWRTGSGKWPTYYPDALPSVVDLGQGSPTALLNGAELNFPPEYQNGLFAADWSFGTLYFVTLEAQGSSYRGEKQEFLYGIPFPLTDVIAGSDGHMYFATGGRSLSSRFYRLRYTGEKAENEMNQMAIDNPSLRELRHELEYYHRPNHEGLFMAWNNLDHPDRFIRYAARIALEHLPVQQWIEQFKIESNAQKIIHSAVALARSGGTDSDLQTQAFNKLNNINWKDLNKNEQLDLIRAYELLLTRMGTPNKNMRNKVIDNVQEIFPGVDMLVNREASEILLFLEDPEATKHGVDLMLDHTRDHTIMDVEMIDDKVSDRHEVYGKDVKAVVEKMPPAEAINYAVKLSHTKAGWTNALREKYFSWFYDVLDSEGGLSFRAFMENIRQQALSSIDEDQRAHFEELSGVYSPGAEMADLPQPKGPGKNYNYYDVNGIVWGLDNYSGQFADGKKMYAAALCSSCHRMNGEGGISGPDLTQLHTRFSRGDMVKATFSPHAEISDQYAFTLFTLKNGRKKAGKIFSENDSLVTILPNPFISTYKTDLDKSEILERSISPISPMPPGLLNRLNEEEIADLFAYLLSGGNKEHEVYGGEVKQEGE